VTAGWNHSIHYYEVLLDAVPAGARAALDVGTGRGGFAQLLATRVERVDAIDRDRASIAAARERSAHVANIRFIEADIMSHELPAASYDFVAAIATLHHLPFAPAIEKLVALLRPSGVLAILGLYRTQTAVDWLASFVALPVSRANRLIRGRADVDAPLREPEMTLDAIRRGAADLLPGATIRRHLLWRYSLLWTKPPR